jgi:hypothetical protein
LRRWVTSSAPEPSRAGGAARLNASFTHFFPRSSDWLVRRFVFDLLRTQRPAGAARDGLHATAATPLVERGGIADRVVFDSSLYTKAAIHRATTRALALLAGVAAAAMLYGSRFVRHR